MKFKYCRVVVQLVAAALVLIAVTVAVNGFVLALPPILLAGFFLGWAHGHDNADERVGAAITSLRDGLAKGFNAVPQERMTRVLGVCDDANAIIARAKSLSPDLADDASDWLAQYALLQRERGK